MKSIKKLYKLAATGALLTAFALNFNACSERSPFTPGENDADASITLSWSQDLGGYKGGTMRLENGSMFHINNVAFNPPPGTDAYKDVTLTMLVEKNEETNELIYTFGPSGSRFKPAAEIRLNWKDVSNKQPDLFYINTDGHYIEQSFDDVDKRGRNFVLYVHHFSRYAVAWSN